MTELTLLSHLMATGAILFGLGLAGFLVRRNVILMFLCAELMLQGVSLFFVSWGRYHDLWSGQAFVTLIIAVAACEAGIALVLVLLLCNYSGVLDIASWQGVRESGVSSFVDCQIPEEGEDAPPAWPTLTPAGILPEIDPEKEMVRPHV